MLDNSDISSDYISDNDLVISETYKKYQKYKLKYLKLLEIYGGKKGKSGRGKQKSKKNKKKEKKKKKKDDEGDESDYDYEYEKKDEDDDDVEYRNKYTEVTPIYTKNIVEPFDKKEILMLPGLVITSLCIISSIISNFR